MNLKATQLIIFIFHFVFQQTASAQASSWNWAKSDGGNGHERIESTSLQYNNHVAISGSFYGDSIDFGQFSFVNSDSTGNSSDAFVAEYDADGKVVWSTTIGGPGMENAQAVKTHLFEETSVAGTFTSEELLIDTFHLKNMAGSVSSYIVRYSRTKEVLWAKSFQNILVSSITVNDEKGDVVITGTFTAPQIKLGPTTLVNKGGADIFILVLDWKGNFLLSKLIGAEGDEHANFISYTPFSKKFSICGSSTSKSWGNKGGKDLFFATFDDGFKELWSVKTGGTEDDEAICIKQTYGEDIYVTGGFSSASVTMGSTTLTNNGNGENVFLAKYNPDGNLLWVKTIGGTNGNGALKVKGLSIANSTTIKKICIAGRFTTPSVSFENYLLSNNGLSNVFVAQYNLDGQLEEVFAPSSARANSDAMGVHLGTDKGIYVAGNFRSADISFGPHVLSNSGDTATSDVFVTRINSITDVSTFTKNKNIYVYPNPSTGKLNIKFDGVGIKKITVFSALGKLILSSTSTEIDLSGEKPGIYFMEILTREKDQLYEKIILN